jgi:hypothetical protein
VSLFKVAAVLLGGWPGCGTRRPDLNGRIGGFRLVQSWPLGARRRPHFPPKKRQNSAVFPLKNQPALTTEGGRPVPS